MSRKKIRFHSQKAYKAIMGDREKTELQQQVKYKVGVRMRAYILNERERLIRCAPMWQRIILKIFPLSCYDFLFYTIQNVDDIGGEGHVDITKIKPKWIRYILKESKCQEK